MRGGTALWLLAMAAAALGQEGKPQVAYIGAESDSSKGLLARWCDVTPARIGGSPFVVGGREAELFSSLAGSVKVAFLDADAAAGAEIDEFQALAAWVRGGGRLLVEGCDGYGELLGDTLPVAVAQARTCGTDEVTVREAGHPALLGVPVAAWDLEGLQVACKARPGTRVLLECSGAPVLVVGEAGGGKVVATPLDHSPETYSWKRTPGYDSLLTLLVLALAGAEDDVLLRESWASACRYWMYDCFPVGYHKYRFGLTGSAVARYDEAEAKLIAAREALGAAATDRVPGLIGEGVSAALQAAEAGQDIGGGLATADAEAASRRDDILRLPGTLATVHGMNLSQGDLGDAGFWYPRSGGESLDDRPRLDMPKGAGESFWRGLHAYVLASGTPATEADQERLWQRTSDGDTLSGPNREIWTHPAVKAAQAQGLGAAHVGAIINETGPEEWNTFGSASGGDFSEFAQVAFRVYLADKGLSPNDLGAASWEEVAPPQSWAPGRLYAEWQGFRALYLQERLKTNLWAMKLVDPAAVAMLQAGELGDPWRVGVGAGAARYVDLLCPQVMRGEGAKADPVALEVACRELWSLSDQDGDGAADYGPGFAARFGWGDPLALPASAHASAAAIAVLTGARGILEPWVSDGAGGSAVATMPEEVFLRWHAAFEPTLRHEEKLLSSTPARAQVGVWDSWHSAAMAEGAGEEGGADTWALPQAREWNELLVRAGFIPRSIYDGHISAETLAGLKCVVVPSTLCVSEEEAATLTGFAQAGGVLVLGCGAGQFDECHLPRAGALGALVGAELGVVSVGEERAEAALGAKWAKRVGAEKLTLGHVTQTVNAGSGAKAGTLADGAATCAVKVGTGQAIFVGATVWAGDGPTQMLLQGLLEDAGVQRRAYAESEEGGYAWQARVLVMDRADGALVGVAHYRPYAEQEALEGLKVRVRMGRGGHRVRRLSEDHPYVLNDNRSEQVRSSTSGGYIEFGTELPPHGVRLFLIEKQ